MTAGLVIVGGGPAGMSAARAFREHGGNGPITLISGDPDAPYDRPPLSKDYLRGETEEPELALAEPGEFEQLQVSVRRVEAMRLDPQTRLLHLADGESLAYQSCVLATGSQPRTLPVPGGDHPRILHLRTLADARRLRAAAQMAESALVIGSGFIGCEAAASLAARGIRVTLVTDESGPQAARLGPDAAQRLAAWLAEDGVQLSTSAEITSISGDDEQMIVRLAGRVEERADLLLVAAGVAPCGALAEAAGLAMKDGRVVTDAQLRSSASGVLAAGDVAFAHNAGAGRRLRVEHWGEALTMGEIAGATAAGASRTWSNAPGFWSQIGERTLKYSAWGDGFEQARLVTRPGGGFTVWYSDASGTAVGVLTHEADDDYERGQHLIEAAVPAPR